MNPHKREAISISPQEIDGFAVAKRGTADEEKQGEMSDQESAAAGGEVRSDGVGRAEDAEIGPEEDDERNLNVQQPRVAADPGQPTARERALHDLLHMPFRTWCYDCLQGQGKDLYHLRLDDESGVPIIAMDYTFVDGKRGDEKFF